ncbi:MAG: glucose-6-phosphate isomerase family protein [Candidatus Dojkabacteria bacterium]|nr:glucose-6-phosphate isomerase family protein [Candidatus Dojkabacteria bacterium]
MAKTDLKTSSGLPLYFNGEEIQSEDFNSNSVSTVSLEDIRPQLLNQDLDCPEVFYSKYKDIDNSEEFFKKKNLRVNIYLMKPNLAGIEFVKSKATRCSSYPRVFEIVYGGGSVLLQKYVSPNENRVYRLQVKKGSKLIIPPGYSVCLVNTRQASTLIVLEISSRESRGRVVLEDKRGMSYYIIRKNAKVEVVRNPAYKIVDKVQKIDMDKLLDEKGITPKRSLIKQIEKNSEKFDWIHKKDDMDF